MDAAATGSLSRSGHLARRFVVSLWPGGPSAESEAWVRSHLLAGEITLWDRLSGPDRRHAVAVARRVDVMLVDPGRPVLAAALLHDVGKVDSGLGTLARVVATVVGMVGGRRARTASGRIGRYLRHPDIGAGLLAEAGSDTLTMAWAGEHHRPPQNWTVDPAIAGALHAADDD